MEGVKINVHSIHAPSVVLGIVVGGAAGSVLSYLLLRNRVRHAVDTEVQSVKDHYRTIADSAKTGARDPGYQSYLNGLNRASALGYGNPSGDLVGAVAKLERRNFELLQGDDDQSDSGADSSWPGTAEDVRGDLEGEDANDESDSRQDGSRAISGTAGSSQQLEPEHFGSISSSIDSGMGSEPDKGQRFSENRDRIDASLIWPPVDRDESKPFRIDADEFNDESYDHYTKISLTYYAGDGVLVDDRDDPIRIFTRVTGPLRVEDFGGVSLDPYIQYVRNHKMESDFDIVLKQTSYADAILNYGNPKGGKHE